MSSDAGGSWTTLDSFQLVAGKGAAAHDVVEDSSGNIFVSGSAIDKKGREHGLLRKKASGGMNWVVVDDVPDYSLIGIHLAPGGSGMFTTFGSAWGVRRSVDGGVTWTTVDQPFPGNPLRAGSDSAGYVYAVGYLNKATQIGKDQILYLEWTVRKWRDGEPNWTTTDDAFATAPVPQERAASRRLLPHLSKAAPTRRSNPLSCA